ncbi:MAG: response regulator [Planctomycetes bacterium]|nr:response regulator [Planctomycetota bacterium]
MRFAPALLATLAAALPGHAQEQIAAQLLAAQTAAAVGSDAWFDLGFERVEVELAYDVAAAVTTARELLAAAANHGPELQSAASALLSLAVTLHDGPTAAAALPQPIPDPHPAPPPRHAPSTTAATRRIARRQTAEARQAYYADVPSEFLPSMFAALASARASNDPGLLSRAGWTLHLVTERNAGAYDLELVREVAAVADRPEAAPFRAWLLVNQYWRDAESLTIAERIRRIDDAMQRAEQIGDRRSQVLLTWDRAVVDMIAERRDEALARLSSGHARTERLGDRRMLAVGYELAAEILLDDNRLEDAEALLAKAAAASGDRGFADRDVQQAHLRLRVATARNHVPEVARETQLLERLRREETARYRGFALLLDQLLTDERERVKLAGELAAEREHTARSRRAMLSWGLLGSTAVLGACTWFALRSRRRLQAAHAALQTEVERAQSEGAARRLLEQRLRQMERVESLGLVASGVAHDFNNLMVAVLGNAEILRVDDQDPERRRLLDAIHAAGERGARLCHELQAYAAAGGREFAALDLARLVHELQPLLQAAAGPSVRTTITVAAGAMPLEGNATELEQVLLNLVANARDAKARTIELRVSRAVRTEADWQLLRVHGQPTAGVFACVEVVDDGEGMRADVVERIFDPFFTTRFPGRGLGLAVVSGALRRHRGAATVDSAIGRGSTFRLYLPMQANLPMQGETTAEPKAPLPAALPRTIAPMSVLVVDDEAHVRDVLVMSLQRRGHRVLAIAEGTLVADALRQLGAAPRLCALVDLTMPGQDGRDVVRALRRARPDLPVLLMSGHAAEHLQATVRELGADGCIAKPFAPSEVEQTLALALADRGQAPTTASVEAAEVPPRSSAS